MRTTKLGAAIGLMSALLLSLPYGVHAAQTAKLMITPVTGSVDAGGSQTVDITLDTGGQEISAVSIALTVPSQLKYESADTANSVLKNELKAPTLTGSTLRFGRISFDKNGFNGLNGQIIRLTFSATGSGKAPLMFDKDTTEVIATADSADVLSSVTGAEFAVGAGATASTPTPEMVSPRPTISTSQSPTASPAISASADSSVTEDVATDTESTDDKSLTYVILGVLGACALAGLGYLIVAMSRTKK